MHLQELRWRLLWCFAALFIGTGFGFLLRHQLATFLLQPLQQPLYFTSPAGAFEFAITLSLFFGVLVCIPVVAYHAAQFLRPVLPASGHQTTLRLTLLSVTLLILGVWFAYAISLPSALHFLATFATNDLHALISADEYLQFVFRYLLGFGLFFQLPLVLVIANMLHPLRTQQLLQAERWVIVISFVLAGILTPTPDIVNQTLMALPLLLLYQFSVVLLWWINRRHAA